MADKDLNELKKDIRDIKALMILFLQSLEVGNKEIANAIGMSPGRVSQLKNKGKYNKK